MDEWKYRKIVKKFDYMISIREMQRYFGFEKLKDLNDFLNKLPENTYLSFHKSDDIINAQILPEYIDLKKLIYELRRKYTLNTIDQPISFTLTARSVTRQLTFKLLEELGVFTKIIETEDLTIINKMLKVKENNFSKTVLPDVKVTEKRIKEMQRYFGFENLDELNNFLNKLPINSLYLEYAIFPDNDQSINITYDIDMHTQIFPEYIIRQQLIYVLRRNFSLGKYVPIGDQNRFEFESVSFTFEFAG